MRKHLFILFVSNQEADIPALAKKQNKNISNSLTLVVLLMTAKYFNPTSTFYLSGKMS